MMIIDNKKLPQIWFNNKNMEPIMKKIYKNKELKKISFDNKKNNKLLCEYNEKLKDEENKNKKKINIYEYNFGFDKNLIFSLKSEKRKKLYLKELNNKNKSNSLIKSQRNIKIRKNNLIKNLSCIDLKNNNNKKIKISNSLNKLINLSDNKIYKRRIIQSYNTKNNDKINCNERRKNNIIGLNNYNNYSYSISKETLDNNTDRNKIINNNIKKRIFDSFLIKEQKSLNYILE